MKYLVLAGWPEQWTFYSSLEQATSAANEYLTTNPTETIRIMHISHEQELSGTQAK